MEEVKENTNVNFVFAVTLNKSSYKKIYIKQAFDYVKIAPTFPAPIDRQLFEKQSIEYLYQFWGDRIPQVINYDAKNNILIVTDMGENAVLLAEEIKKGQLHLNIGQDLGLMMAELHVPTYAKDEFPVRNKEKNCEHAAFIFDFRLRGAKEVIPEETAKLFKESKYAKNSMIYGDWASKNVFISDNKVRLIDFENLVRFDPAFDIGYALAHWVLDISKENQNAVAQFFRDFEQAYKKKWHQTLQNDVESIFRRSARYTGAMMLHRLTGVKNTNRMEEYLSREISLIATAKSISLGNYAKPSTAIEGLTLDA